LACGACCTQVVEPGKQGLTAQLVWVVNSTEEEIQVVLVCLLPTGSMLGSFSEGAAAAALGATGHDTGAVPLFSSRAYTVSDDDIQQPPQQLQRLVAQQQMLSLHLQQAQQQAYGAAAAAAGAGPRQQQQQQPAEVFGPWSAPAAARLTGQSSISSVGSDRGASEHYQGLSSAGECGPGSSLGPSPQPPNLQQYGAFSTGGGEEGSGSGAGQAAALSPRQLGGTALQHQHSGGRAAAPAAGGSTQAAAAAAAAAAIAAAGAATATESGAGTPHGWSSAGGASGAAAAAGSGNTSGHGAGSAHPQLLAMVGHPLAGSNAGARNWELFSGAAELEDRLVKVSGRMQEMGFTEQRIKVRARCLAEDASCVGAGAVWLFRRFLAFWARCPGFERCGV
jgi:hypothetical protein